ncbi:unnamed protein product [Mesocestoides corti]|uniref:Secreted protein n=1 Tax=Mesocestoides corti TaxID=53468 RepID=A0A0R3UB29_MESCO|nr:unnamed protein product [Mesocestoides corti]
MHSIRLVMSTFIITILVLMYVSRVAEAIPVYDNEIEELLDGHSVPEAKQRILQLDVKDVVKEHYIRELA